ncbi:bifunctional riboflavin kinase/FAD synthetase [Inquilinus limosus]|uniref:bifunctional riboflavin kinase/FAD synthetase n=1 Tax=Inquilinus limosus TaxID=171674 RepID=UPI000410E09D|nr:bifunctional riboflavin kinase/FAD synthetase [Inquilinus limosus]
MQIFRHYENLPASARGAVVAIGNFDGVHRGHQTVVAAARAEARRLGVPVCVLSFEPHPRSLFRPQDPPFRLTPFRIKARLLEALGVDLHVVLHFDWAFAARSAEDFIETVLVGALGARHVVVGYDFCFGHRRAGTPETLAAHGRRLGFGVTIVTQASDETGGLYSSSRTREMLAAGDMRGAAEILGRPWEIEGRVEHGDKRGRELGYPTANVELGESLRPAYGIYAVRCAVDEGGPLVWRDGVASLGIRPMWRTETPLLEAYLFDFSGDLYHRHLRVQLVERLRGEEKFDSLEALVAQIDRDCEAARRALAR